MRKPIEKIDFTFKAGEKLTSSQLNILIGKINEVIEYINKDVIPNEINLNRELGDMEKIWTVGQALAAIPSERLSPGIKVSFLGNNGWVTWYNNPITGVWETDYFTELNGGEW